MFKIKSRARHALVLIRSCHHKQAIRVRFAPSPTGYLHLGGLRTALYNFLFAKANDGAFILRIEDTDQSRVVEGAAKQIQEDLNWAGIYINEGPGIGGAYGPYVQSQRLQIYREHVQLLLDTNKAYRCFCTSKRLDILRKEGLKARQIPRYDNRCRHLDADDVKSKLDQNLSHCIRFKLAQGLSTFSDMVYGNISYDVAINEGDPIILKSDGYPTYHFANVVDDHLMEISHVLRGVEWQISTTKHIMMYDAFGWKSPTYGHLPLLVNSDGTKLSKRQGDIQISHYRDGGILPLALINFIVSSGGGFSKDLERGLKPQIYTKDELAQQFSVNKINTNSGRLMPELLNEFNRFELERLVNDKQDLQVLVGKVQNLLRLSFPDRVSDNSLKFDDDYVKSILQWAVGRIENLNDLVSHQLSFLWVLPSTDAYTKADIQHEIIVKLKYAVEKEECFNRKNLIKMLKIFSEDNDVVFSTLMRTLRSVLSGLKEGPSVAEMIEILGKENTLLRIKKYIDANSI